MFGKACVERLERRMKCMKILVLDRSYRALVHRELAGVAHDRLTDFSAQEPRAELRAHCDLITLQVPTWAVLEDVRVFPPIRIPQTHRGIDLGYHPRVGQPRLAPLKQYG